MESEIITTTQEPEEPAENTTVTAPVREELIPIVPTVADVVWQCTLDNCENSSETLLYKPFKVI